MKQYSPVDYSIYYYDSLDDSDNKTFELILDENKWEISINFN
jgi:succinate dehydrogenase flavin-adding protein (antitoxin of CptAB toxin-antitoxin module)